MIRELIRLLNEVVDVLYLLVRVVREHDRRIVELERKDAPE